MRASEWYTWLSGPWQATRIAGLPTLSSSYAGAYSSNSLSDGGAFYTGTPVIGIVRSALDTNTSNGSCTAVMTSRAPTAGGGYVSSCSCSGGTYSVAPALYVLREVASDPGNGATVSATIDGSGTLSGCSVNNYQLPSNTFNAWNLHYYQGGNDPENARAGASPLGGQPVGFLQDNLVAYTWQNPNLPSWVTESSYYTILNDSNHQGITEDVQAAYIPRLLLNDFAHGITRTYLYEFADNYQGKRTGIKYVGQLAQNSYGLARYDQSFKPSFHALQNLINFLRDPGPAFTPTPLNLTITGGSYPPSNPCCCRSATERTGSQSGRSEARVSTRTPSPAPRRRPSA